jgi:hypothetical protein
MEDNIKMAVREVRYESMNCVYLDQDSGQSQALVITDLSFEFQKWQKIS